MLEFRLARRKLVRPQDVSDDVGVPLVREGPWPIGWHGNANSLKQIAHRQPVPIGKELASGQRRSRFATRKRITVTPRALSFVGRLAPIRLFRRINTVPDRARCLLRKQRYRKGGE